MHAAKRGHVAVVLMMLERGAGNMPHPLSVTSCTLTGCYRTQPFARSPDWNATDQQGRTAADIAEEEAFADVVRSRLCALAAGRLMGKLN